ncbi:hypothetical protein GobsT_37700 [Gemmata obscuriglobus]|uniref:hypothetical protein n=1 Tax=Gemmata obscuriglobus TaxID=114 RepID=UPI0011CD0F69|nr:hypothetical protein [Gemmata obscuriglobus]QEG28981.1 hypothetical protein GobsT_37700 [Gemmata obscuriglobus]VTS07537.1 unnamed protein product [Gemmata obscuriglobus UQM 2246]
MPAVYVIAIVPAGTRDLAEAAVSPYLTSPPAAGAYSFAAPLVPFPGPASAAPTAYGCCAPCGPETVAALGGLTAAIPGSAAHTVDPAVYDRETHVIAWLAARGYQPQVLEPVPV